MGFLRRIAASLFVRLAAYMQFSWYRPVTGFCPEVLGSEQRKSWLKIWTFYFLTAQRHDITWGFLRRASFSLFVRLAVTGFVLPCSFHFRFSACIELDPLKTGFRFRSKTKTSKANSVGLIRTTVWQFVLDRLPRLCVRNRGFILLGQIHTFWPPVKIREWVGESWGGGSSIPYTTEPVVYIWWVAAALVENYSSIYLRLRPSDISM